jgi:tetratricopeptide (TPR) repeat protein
MKSCALLVFFFIPVCLSAQSYQKRLALVIGNSNYQNGGSLPNPVNDATAIAAALQSVGFEVMKHQNVTQKEMKMAINAFGQKLHGYEVGVFYYAGHGIQNKGMNYMIPVEADLQNEEQVEFDCVAADRVLAYMDAAQVKVNVIIMDACRNNPFERSWHRSASGNGLAMMNAPTGSLIAYATAPGRVASDGAGSNGLYTSALLKYLNDPKLSIEQVFKKVRTEVTEKSAGAQVPWETTSLTGDDFYFAADNISKGSIVKNDVLATNTEAKNSAVKRNLTEVTEESRKKAGALLAEGHTAYNESNHSKAIELYTRAIQVNSSYDEAYYWRASSKYSQKKYKEAIPDYDKAIALNPNSEEAYYYRALTNYNLEAYAETLPDFNKAIELNPDVASMHYWRGEVKYRLELYEEAIIDYSKSLELNRNNDGPSFNGRANCYYMLKKYKEARIDYTKAIELVPADAVSYKYYRGICNYNLDLTREALDDFIAYLEKDPNESYILLMAAHSLFVLKDYQQAVQYYSKAISAKSDYTEAYYWRGQAYFNLGRKSDALRDVDKALSLDPENETYLNFRRDNLK